jgi:hypothetical protein
MRIYKISLIVLVLFLFSCSASNPNIKSITLNDVNSYLKQAPKPEDHPNAGVDLLYT